MRKFNFETLTIIFCIIIIVGSLSQTRANVTVLLREINTVNDNKSLEHYVRLNQEEYNRLKQTLNQLLSIELRTVPVPHIYSIVSASNADVIITSLNVGYSPLEQVAITEGATPQETNTEGTQPADATAEPTVTTGETKDILRNPSVFLSVRGDVAPLLTYLDKHLNYKLLSYSEHEGVETASIEIRR